MEPASLLRRGGVADTGLLVPGRPFEQLIDPEDRLIDARVQIAELSEPRQEPSPS